MIHIQKIAPGPPVRIAPQAPTILPVPTWAAMAVVRAWKELMPPCCSAVQGEVAEDFLHPFPKTADLYEAGAHSEVNACADQQDD